MVIDNQKILINFVLLWLKQYSFFLFVLLLSLFLVALRLVIIVMH